MKLINGSRLIAVVALLFTTFIISACEQPYTDNGYYETVWGPSVPDTEGIVTNAEESSDTEEQVSAETSIADLENDLIVQEPGNSPDHVMSQDAVTKYVKKVRTRNILDVTFYNSNIDSEGKYSEKTSGTCFASSPNYVECTGDKFYTLSWQKNDLNVHVYVFEYDGQQQFIKWTNVGSTNSKTSSAIKLDKNCSYVRIKLWGDLSDVAWNELVPDNFQMELGTDATPYVKPIAIDTSEIDIKLIADQIIESGMIDNAISIKYASTQNPIIKQIAHRGYRATGAPQCTAPAYIEAKLAGYEAGENDLWVTTDGVFVMAHDVTMPSDPSVVVAESTYEALLACNMGTYKGKEIEIMTFEKWLLLMKKIGLEAYVDLKSPLNSEQATEIMNIVRKHGMLDKVTWSTNSTETIKGLRAAYPYARLALIGWTEINSYVLDLRIEGRPDLTVLYPQSIEITDTVIENAHNAGIGVECWHVDYSSYGFETEEEVFAEIDRIVGLGVTGICLDTYLPSEYFFNKLISEWN